ncbi:OmpA family protein [Paracoccus rhizosphaerae]|uniref:OmpA family protein n=1 Tax=Paracoccus rhizosphaerae TaxID=1133347 RepID=A0ABV6CGI3_9RHOB|nr:OmpA family protein [Paracoccus rhizosphaerae]
MASSRRITTSLATILVLAGAGGLAWVGAEAAATFVEDRTAAAVGQALQTEGHDWVQIETDGLQVRLTGTAPSEVERFRAMSRAAAAAGTARIIDQMTVASVEEMAPPDFQIEFLRGDMGVSLIGLIPAGTDREAILQQLRPTAPDRKLSDLLEAADHPAPDGWEDALRFGLQAVGMTGQSKISVAPGHVQVAALARDAADQARLETALRAAAPAGVTLDLQVTAPRPVISPFTLSFAVSGTGAEFEACVADTEEARDQILAAAAEAGLRGSPDCLLGLGAPSADWGDAAAAAIRAVGTMGRGSVTLSNAQIALTAPEGVARARFESAVAELQAALPQAYTLEARLQEPKQSPRPIEFHASLSDRGALTMQGRIADAAMREAVSSFAAARFDVAQSGLRADPRVPEGWTVRVIAGLEAMAALQSGTVDVTPQLITLRGMSGSPAASERAAALLTERLGAGARFELAIGYDRRLDPSLDLPDGEECARRLNVIMSESELGFEPGGSSIAGDPNPTLALLSDTMAECSEYQLEAAGHTDSQGSDQFNAELSRSRAQAILMAMQWAGIEVSNMTARGYGESQPIAPNNTEAGREANRRIEFRLLSPHPVRAEAPQPPQPVTGVTGQPLPSPESEPEPALPAPMPAQMQGPRLPPVQGPMQVPEPLPPIQGPQLPPDLASAGTTPLTLGVQEEAPSAAEREESLRVPVQIADETTPRPGPRPGDLADPDPAQDGSTDE